MFYTLISKLPIISNNSNRKFLKVFILGSVLYVLLHYWLHSDTRPEFVEKLKGYLYFVMLVDMCVGWWFSRPTIESDDDAGEKKYTPDERNDIMKNLDEMRKMQMMRQQMMAPPVTDVTHEKHESDEKKSSHSPFVKRNNAESDKPEKSKPKEDTTSSSHSKNQRKHVTTDSPKKAQPKASKKNKESETPFPIFMGQDEE